MSVLTKGNLEMLDDTFSNLVTPTYVPPPRPVLPKFVKPDYDEDRNKKLESDFNLLRVDTESPDNSESSDTFTVTSTSGAVYSTGSNRNSVSSYLESPASKNSTGSNSISFGELDNFFNNAAANNTNNRPLPPFNPPITKQPPTQKPPATLISLEDLLDAPDIVAPSIPPMQPMQPIPFQQRPLVQPNINFNNEPVSKPPTVLPPPPQIYQKKEVPSVTQQQPVIRPEPVKSEPKRPVQLPAFDPSQIMKRFEERASVIYLTAVVKEKLEVVYTGNNRTKYQLIGEVMVKPFSSDKTHGVQQHDFTLSLSRVDKIASVRCNPKYCEQFSNEYNFKCQVPANEVDKNPVVLLRYKLHDNIQPMPIILQPKFKLSSGDNTMTLMVKYKVNPDTPLRNLSLLIQPVMKEHADKQLSVVAAQSKPEGRWTQQQQKLLWRLSDIRFNPEEKQGSSLMAKFKMSSDPTTFTTYVPGPILIKLNTEGATFGGVYVEGGDSKRNAVTNQVFVGGCEYGIECTDFQYILTQESLVV
jgi:hypothetical protein